MLVEFLYTDPFFEEKIKHSLYSGIDLNFLQRSGRNQFSIQNPDDDWTYYEAWLLGYLQWCSSAEQLMMNIKSLKSRLAKLNFLELVVELWDEGKDARESDEPIESIELNESEKRIVASKFKGQSGGYQRYPENEIVKPNREVHDKDDLVDFFSDSGLLCYVFKARGELIRNSIRLLVVDCLVNGSDYTLEPEDNVVMFHFVNRIFN